MFGLEAGRRVFQHIAALPPAGRHHAQRSLHEPAPSHAIGTAADPSPDHRESQRPLRRVVRRLDPLDPAGVHRPSSTLRISKHVADVFTQPHFDPLFQGLANLSSQPSHPIALERLPIQSHHPGPGASCGDSRCDRFNNLSPIGLAVTPAIDHRLEIAAKMSPTNLSPPGRGPLVGAEPIAADDLIRLAAQQGPGHLARAVSSDGGDRGDTGHGRPEPRLFARSSRHEVSSMFTAFAGVDRDGEFVVRGFQDLGTASLQLGAHPGGDRQPEKVGGQLLGLPLAQPVSPRGHGQDGLQIRPESAGGDARRQGPASRRSAAGTGRAMEPILIDDRLDPGQFGDLMDQRRGIFAEESVTTSSAGRRFAVWRSRGLSRAGPRRGGPCDAWADRRVSCRWEEAGGFRLAPMKSEEGGLCASWWS